MTAPERKTILIVDDETDAREALSEFLQVNGYVVASAENGQAAFDMMQTLLPNLILLDLIMPVMDGGTFLRLAQKDARLRDVPVIVTTAHQSPSAPGAQAVLSKPIRPETLLPLLRRFIDHH